MKKVLFYLFVFIFIQFFASYIVWGVWYLVEGTPVKEVLHLFGTGKLNPTADMMVAASAVYSLATLLVFVRCKWFTVTKSYIESRPMTAMLWCGVLSLGTIIPAMALQELLPELDNNMKDVFESLMTKPTGYLVIGILAPVVEEVVFRGAMISALREHFKGIWGPVLITAALFALVHLNPVQIPHAFLVGILLGWLYCKFGTIIPGVVVHWVNNTVAYVVYFLVPASRDGKLIDIFGSEQRVLLAVVFSLMIFCPALFQLIHTRVKR